MMNQSFTAHLERDMRFGIPIFYVLVPTEVLAVWGKTGHIPVVGTANGVDLKKTNILPSNNQEHCLALNAEVRKAAQLEVGDEVTLQLALDLEPRDFVLPDDFAIILEEQPEIKATFERLPNWWRKYVITDLEKTKNIDTRARRIAKYMEEIVERGRKLKKE
jgi:Domain of unknown function (DUF1905)/Bacteriocin-protection, YdeI or OmpD-Associated